jgi:hypothetical protein
VIVDFPKKEIMAHAFERAGGDWYQEPVWCSARLFDEEKFDGSIWDPACGGGNIPEAAKEAGYETAYSDIENRGYYELATLKRDFFSINEPCDNIVTNPPFNRAQLFAKHALTLARGKVAMIYPTRRLNAASWLRDTPLRRIWLLTPRPSMPPGEAIAAGQKIGGGKVDFCWLVWEKRCDVRPEIWWLHRDRAKQK